MCICTGRSFRCICILRIRFSLLRMVTREDVVKIMGWLIAAFLALNAMECDICP